MKFKLIFFLLLLASIVSGQELSDPSTNVSNVIRAFGWHEITTASPTLNPDIDPKVSRAAINFGTGRMWLWNKDKVGAGNGAWIAYGLVARVSGSSAPLYTPGNPNELAVNGDGILYAWDSSNSSWTEVGTKQEVVTSAGAPIGIPLTVNELYIDTVGSPDKIYINNNGVWTLRQNLIMPSELVRGAMSFPLFRTSSDSIANAWLLGDSNIDRPYRFENGFLRSLEKCGRNVVSDYLAFDDVNNGNSSTLFEPLTNTGSWTLHTLDGGNYDGLNGGSYESNTAGSTITIQTRSFNSFSGFVNGLRVFFKNGTGGTFSISADGGTAIPFTIPAGSSWSFVDIAGLPLAAHSFTITVNSGLCRFYGCEGLTSETGVKIYKFAKGNTKTSHWSNLDNTDFLSTVSYALPDLVIINLGLNDVGTNTPAQMVANIETVMNRIKSVKPNCEFFLISPFIPGSSPNPIYQEIRDAYLLFAEKNNIGVIDLQEYFYKSWSDNMTANLVASDLVHLTENGGDYVSALVVEKILGANCGKTPVTLSANEGISITDNNIRLGSTTASITGSDVITEKTYINTKTKEATITIDTTGFVGFGNPNPVDRIDVTGNIRMNNWILSNTGNNDGTNFLISTHKSPFTTTAQNNVGLGLTTLFNLTTGYSNAAIGAQALYNAQGLATTVALGVNTGYNLKEGIRNFIGSSNALRNGTNVSYSIAIGFNALTPLANTSARNIGSHNTCIASFPTANSALFPITLHETSIFGNGNGRVDFYADSIGQIGLGMPGPTFAPTGGAKVEIGGKLRINDVSNTATKLVGLDATNIASTVTLGPTLTLVGGTLNTTASSAKETATIDHTAFNTANTLSESSAGFVVPAALNGWILEGVEYRTFTATSTAMGVNIKTRVTNSTAGSNLTTGTYTSGNLNLTQTLNTTVSTGMLITSIINDLPSGDGLTVTLVFRAP